MAPKKPPRPPQTPAEIKKEFIKTIQQLSYTQHTWQAWQDFTELAALSIAQATAYSEEREQTYMRTIGRYTHKEAQLIPKLLALTIQALEIKHHDFLGEMFMELELGSKWHGQFFTPYHLCLLMAELTVSKEQLPYHLCLLMAELTVSKEQFENDNIVSVNEPAVGAGAMVIALCDHLRNLKINYQRQLKIITQDTDYIACCMCYIQLSLLGCSAVIIHGNTLTLECRNYWYTPMAMTQYFTHWAQDMKSARLSEVNEIAETELTIQDTNPRQLTLLEYPEKSPEMIT
jgi:hypothetical protein